MVTTESATSRGTTVLANDVIPLRILSDRFRRESTWYRVLLLWRAMGDLTCFQSLAAVDRVDVSGTPFPHLFV